MSDARHCQVISCHGRDHHIQWSSNRGDSNPRRAVVLLHSLGADLRIWQGVVQQWARLARESRSACPVVLSVDLPGHGLSPVGETPYRIEALADSVAALVDTLQLQSVVVCGLSVGGQVAQAWASRNPRQVSALCLAATAPVVGSRGAWQQRIEAVKVGGMTSVADAVISRWFSADFQASHPQVVREHRSRLLSTPAEGYLATLHALRDADLRSCLGKIQQPTLVLAGDQDTATPPALVQQMMETLPRAEFHLLKGAGHTLPIELPAAFAGRLSAFFNTVADLESRI